MSWGTRQGLQIHAKVLRRVQGIVGSLPRVLHKERLGSRLYKKTEVWLPFRN